jgi:hypothetical protein
MRNTNQPDNLEDFKTPAPAMEDLAKKQIQNHEYESAYGPLSKAEMADAQWNDLSKGIENASLPEDRDRKEPLSPEEYEQAQQEELNKNVDAYGVEADKTMEVAEDYTVIRKDINKLIEELLDAIEKARKQTDKVKKNRATTTIFPVIGSIFGIAKTRKLKKLLNEVKEKQDALKDKEEELKTRIDIDGLSPAFNHDAMIASGIFGTAGIVTGNIGMGLAGGVFDVIGTLRAFESHEQLIRLDIKLEDFEAGLKKALENNTESIIRLETYRGHYRDGVIENLQARAA